MDLDKELEKELHRVIDMAFNAGYYGRERPSLLDALKRSGEDVTATAREFVAEFERCLTYAYNRGMEGRK